MSNEKSVNKKRNTMEITKVSASLLVSIVLAFGAFMLQTGIFRQEVKNLKEDIIEVKEVKADKIVVAMMLTSMKEDSIANTTQHTSIMKKLDKLIEGKIGEK